MAIWDIKQRYKLNRDFSVTSVASKCMWGGGNTGSTTNVIDEVNPVTTGDATDFGDLLAARQFMGGAGNKIKGIFGGGDGASNVIQSFYFNSKGNCSDFGDLTQSRLGLAACGNELTAVFGGGDSHPSYYNVIDQVFYATTGNAIDFGDLQAGESYVAASSSPTRGVWFGGNDGSDADATAHYITFASKGDASDFGDMSTAKNQNTASGNNKHAIITNGQATLANGSYEKCIIATTGSFSDYDDLTVGRFYEQGASNQIKGLHGGGANPGVSNIIDFTTFFFKTEDG